MEKSILLEALKNKSFEEKVEYFSDKAINSNINSYNLEGEDLLCFAIAKQKEEGVYSTIERAVKIEIAHLKSLLRKYYEGNASKGFMPKELILCEEQLEYLENYFIDKPKHNKKKGVQYFIGEPHNGGKRVSSYEFSKTVFPNIEINPVHNCELLIKHRIKQFEEGKADLISERELDNVPVTEYDINFLYSMWLQSELKTIQNWLSPLYPNGTKKNIIHSNSQQIEINKYCFYVNSEIEITDRKINPAKRRENFENWIKLMDGEVQINKIDWREVAFKRNTGKAYQHKQDLVACFGNGYIYYQQKFEVYFKEFNKIPYDVFSDLIFEFRQSFPKHGRVEGVNYFDDLVEQLIEKYTPLLKTLPPQQTYKPLLSELTIEQKNSLAVKITGYGKENLNAKTQPEILHIKPILSENNLTPLQAIDIINDFQNTFSPEFNKIMLPKIISYLRDIPKIEQQRATLIEIKQSTTKINPATFKDIFSNEGWEKYISAMEQTEPALINAKREFIGKPKLHKGVVCSWIKYLQSKGVIKLNVNRSQLAFVLNNEFSHFNVGTGGKTFDNISIEFDNNYKEQLINLTN